MVIILNNTLDIIDKLYVSAKVCYSDKNINCILDNCESNDEKLKLISKVIDMGHHSILEHASMTFGIENISRALSHQLVRHRIASYSQQSQRYVNSSNFQYIIPESINNSEFKETYISTMNLINSIYLEMINKNIPKEDARYLLPNATETKIVMTMNIRELFHFLNLRMCERAQWEIRKMAYEIYTICYNLLPDIFKYAGPNCVIGRCKEKTFSCGKQLEVNEKVKSIRK